MGTLKAGRYTIPDEQWHTASTGQWVTGTDNQTGKRVFIKEFRRCRYCDEPENFVSIRRQNERTESYRLRMERVREAVRGIADSGGDVVFPTDFFRAYNRLYKVDEFVESVPWKPEEVHEHLSPYQVDALMLRLADTVSALHRAGLLHGDLKPENLFIVERDGEYTGVLSGFDDSFFMDKIPSGTEIVGTPEYMSPELAAYVLGDEDEPMEALPIGPASDMFSLGLIYHMYLTGEMPSFDAVYSGNLFIALFDGADYALSGKLDASHYTLIQRLLVPDPHYRIDSASTLAEEIGRILRARGGEYRLTLRTEEGLPLSDRSIPLFCAYPIGSGDYREENIEAVQTVRTDGEGTAVLSGLLPELRLFVECGDQLKPIQWRENNGVMACTLSGSFPEEAAGGPEEDPGVFGETGLPKEKSKIDHVYFPDTRGPDIRTDTPGGTSNGRNEEAPDSDFLLFDDEDDSSSFFDDMASPFDGEDDGTGQPEPGETKRMPHTQFQGFQTDVDLVLVIDCTGGGHLFLDELKEHAGNLYQKIVDHFATKMRSIHTFRVRVVAFRDYYFDWADPEYPPMTESGFFTLPDEQDEFAAFMNGLWAVGGEDEPESALEALHLAFHSPWNVDPEINKRRQIIMLFTDSSAHPLDDPMRYDPEFNLHYPDGMPESLEALYEEYVSPEVFPADDQGYPAGHRLVLFAPENMYPWDKMCIWSECMTRPVESDLCLSDVTMEDVFEIFAGSI